MKYARLELERSFLIAAAPTGFDLGPPFGIEDVYIEGTRLRLRKITGPEGSAYKLTQKHAAHGDPAVCVITSIYLDASEHHALSSLPGNPLRKSRRRFAYEGQNYALDTFEGPLAGLTLAETEFETEEQMRAFDPPAFLGAEVTSIPEFGGGWLAHLDLTDLRLVASREDLKL